ncbi:MAG: hypothetical protein H6899_11255 [Rhodobacter sp.]|nr:hypothetical protein [Paracoccaceae bacterium]MCC0080505.1 hypothetical protein [Rhodobacter sp.]
MRTPLITLLVVCTALSGCGSMRESRFNPRNWFGHSREEAPTLGPTQTTIDNRALVTQVTALTIERTSSGAILRAEGLTPTAGWWDAELVPENYGRPQAGVLTLRFVAAAPREASPDTGPASRTLVVAYALTQAQLDTTADVVVTGAENSRRIRR